MNTEAKRATTDFGQARVWLAAALNRWRHIKAFSRLLVHHFIRDGGILNSAALTYTTLLSLVPLITVMLALFSVFPASDKVAEEIESFVFMNFVPAAGETVREHLVNFSQKAGKLTGVGFVFLILVSLMLMSSIDKAFNTIWHVKKKRSAIATFTVYWAILSLGPILIVFSVGATSYLVSMPLFVEAQAAMQFKTKLLGAMPVVISSLAFMLLYALVPNRQVPLRHALAGGILAALLFELAKRGFAYYVTQFPTYEAIYGAMAAVPIFLIWIYLSWLVTLLGAEFTYCLGIYRADWQDSNQHQGDLLHLMIRLISHLHLAQQSGGTLTDKALAKREKHIPDDQLHSAMERLVEASFVVRTEDKSWALTRDLNQTRLIDLYRLSPFVIPGETAAAQGNGRLDKLLSGLNGNLDQSMDIKLIELVEQSG